MNNEEKEQLKDEILAEVEKRFAGIALKEDTQGVLAEVREKWFTDGSSSNQNSLMYKAFGAVTYWKVWELIRKLTCLIFNCGYVRHLTYIKDHDEVLRVADTLCQTVYELRRDFMEGDE